MRHQAGFTLIEAAISSAVLGLILLAGVTVTRSVLESSDTTTQKTQEAMELRRAVDEAVDTFESIGSSTLWGLPTGGTEVEPLIEGYVYPEIRFRRPVGFVAGEVVYDPPIADDPESLAFVSGGKYERNDSWGQLVHTRGDRTTTVVEAARDVRFTKVGNVLSMQYEALASDGKTIVPVTRKMHLRAR